MPAPIVSGLCNFISSNFSVVVWDGEVPRYDPSGRPINPDSTVTPTTWPVVRVFMSEQGFTREWTTEDPFTDRGEILVQVWATNRADVESALSNIEGLLAKATNWQQINLGGDPSNPNYVIQLLLTRWCSVPDMGPTGQERTSKSELLYRGDLYYDCMIHGAVSTA